MNNSDFNIRDVLFEYHYTIPAIVFVGFETFIVALVVALKQDFVFGILTFIVLLIAWNISVIGGVLLFTFSLLEALLVASLLANYTSVYIVWFVGYFLFIFFSTLHKVVIELSERSYANSLIVFEIFLVSFIFYFQFDSLLNSILLFFGLLIISFIPIVRTLETILMSVFLSLAFYSYVRKEVIIPAAILVSILFFLYTSYLNYQASKLINYKEMFAERKQQKEEREAESAYLDLKSKLYSKWPELEKDYYYFSTVVCKDGVEMLSFLEDWRSYLNSLHDLDEIISFNQYFEKEKLYTKRTYYSDFAQEYGKRSERSERQDDTEQYEKEDYLDLFKGVSNQKELHKRYKDLLKIYHPDNQTGDTFMTQKIQSIYEKILKDNNWDNETDS